MSEKNNIEKLSKKYPVLTPTKLNHYFLKNRPTTTKGEVKESFIGRKIILKGKIVKRFPTQEELQLSGKTGEIVAASTIGFGAIGIKLSFERDYLIADDDYTALIVKVPTDLKEDQEITILGNLVMTKEKMKVECIKILEKSDE